MVRWLRWHCPPDTGFEIRALAVWGRARYFSVTAAPHNTDFHTWMGKKHFCFFQTAVTGNRTPNSGVKGSGANHYPRAPALRGDDMVKLLILVLFETKHFQILILNILFVPNNSDWSAIKRIEVWRWKDVTDKPFNLHGDQLLGKHNINQ